MRVTSFALLSIAVAGAVLNAEQQATSTTRLPITRVVLYKSGVGYFEHVGRVQGTQQITIEFTSSQLDDVLKSLTALDLDGGRVSGVTYNSDAGLARRLSGLRLPLGESATRAQLLTALRGARLEVRRGTVRHTGRLLNVESRQRRGPEGVFTVDVLHLVTDGGDVQSTDLDEDVTVRILETDLNEEVSRYLAIMASSRDRDIRRLSMTATGTGERDLFVSYVSEVPVWKSTYRLVLGDAAPLLQGWAIVDNTIGEDWTNVELSLVAGAPQAFIQQVSRPYYVQRPVVPLPERFLSAPQTHDGAIVTAGAGSIAGQVTDSSGGPIPGATVQVQWGGITVMSAATNREGGYRIANLSPGTYDVAVSLTGFRTATQRGVRIASGTEPSLRHVLEVGAMTEEVMVSAAVDALSPAPVGLASGRGGAGLGSRVQTAQAAVGADASGADLGDLFEYKLSAPVTIQKNQSALVPIVSGTIGAEKVSLWNASSSGIRPLRAVWLTNSTGQTLDGGSVSIVEGQVFAGEGLIEPLKAGERRLVSYATDLAVSVTSAADMVPSRITRVQVNRGVMIQHREDRQRRTYTIRNDDAQPRVVVLEHPIRDGWTLDDTTKADESSAGSHRFRVTVPAQTTSTVTVGEMRPGQSRIAIGNVDEAQARLLIDGGNISPELSNALREVVRRRAGVQALQAEIAARETEIATIGRDQERLRENLKALKGTAEERQLVQRYVRQLDEQETRLAALREELRSLTAKRAAAAAELAAFIEGITG